MWIAPGERRGIYHVDNASLWNMDRLKRKWKSGSYDGHVSSWNVDREKRRSYMVFVKCGIGLGAVDADVMKAAGGGSR